MEFLSRLLHSIQSVFLNLNLAQRFYVAALIYFIASILSWDVEDEAASIGLIALIGLAIDMWPKLVAIWESLLGRVVLLASYIIIGNMAVNSASHKLNEIVGIDPSPLFYSKGFVTLLMAPIWILSATLILMMVFFMVTNTVLWFRVVLKLLRFRLKSSSNEVAYPTRTLLLKLVLLPFMFVPVVSAIEEYGNELSGPDVNYSWMGNSVTFGTTGMDGSEQTDPGEAAPEETSEDDSFNMNLVIAQFVYNIETYQHSQCMKEDDQKALFIGETDVLLVRKNEEAEHGYDFIVTTCELRREVHGNTTTE